MKHHAMFVAKHSTVSILIGNDLKETMATLNGLRLEDSLFILNHHTIINYLFQ